MGFVIASVNANLQHIFVNGEKYDKEMVSNGSMGSLCDLKNRQSFLYVSGVCKDLEKRLLSRFLFQSFFFWFLSSSTEA